MKIYLAHIDHRHGTNMYAAWTKQALDSQLAEFCVIWWNESCGDEEMPTRDVDIIDTYFDENSEDYLYRDEIEMPAPDQKELAL